MGGGWPGGPIDGTARYDRGELPGSSSNLAMRASKPGEIERRGLLKFFRGIESFGGDLGIASLGVGRLGALSLATGWQHPHLALLCPTVCDGQPSKV